MIVLIGVDAPVMTNVLYPYFNMLKNWTKIFMYTSKHYMYSFVKTTFFVACVKIQKYNVNINFGAAKFIFFYIGHTRCHSSHETLSMNINCLDVLQKKHF
jgi:hypothetical protein